jgi:hypothetical protein
MYEKLTRFFASHWGIILAGVVIGVLVPLLQYAGNPKNMSICMACFERDIAGARAHWERAAAQWKRSGLPHQLARTRALIGGLASE